MSDNFAAGGITFKSKELAGAVQLLLQGLADQAGADAMGLVTAAPDPLTLLGRLKTIADALSTEQGLVDGLEGLATTNNTLATALNGYVDGVEGLLGQIAGYVDGLEALTAALSGKLPAALGPQAGAGSLSVVPSTDQDPIFDQANAAATRAAVTNASSVVFTPPAGCKYARFHATVDTLLRLDDQPAADAAGSILILANQPEPLPVVAGVAVRALRLGGADGVIRCTPMKVR